MNQCGGQVGELCRRDVRAASLEGVIRNASAAGGDGITTEQVKSAPSAWRGHKPGLTRRREGAKAAEEEPATGWQARLRTFLRRLGIESDL